VFKWKVTFNIFIAVLIIQRYRRDDCGCVLRTGASEILGHDTSRVHHNCAHIVDLTSLNDNRVFLMQMS